MNIKNLTLSCAMILSLSACKAVKSSESPLDYNFIRTFNGSCISETKGTIIPYDTYSGQGFKVEQDWVSYHKIDDLEKTTVKLPDDTKCTSRNN